MHVTYDKGADAVYIDFGYDRSKSGEVLTEGEWPFNVDVDEQGNILGIEIMEAASNLSPDFFKKAESIGKD